LTLDSPSFRPILPLESLQKLLIRPSIMKKLTFPLSFGNLYLLAILMVSAVSKFAKLTDSINWKDYLVLKVFKKTIKLQTKFFL